MNEIKTYIPTKDLQPNRFSASLTSPDSPHNLQHPIHCPACHAHSLVSIRADVETARRRTGMYPDRLTPDAC